MSDAATSVNPQHPLLEFADLMRVLRDGCPWKQEQTHRSLAKYLLEETHETLEAIDALDAGGDPDHLAEELGDVLLQVYFHAAIAEERGDFTIADVAAGIVEKMRRRNPHVLGDLEVGSAAEASAAWDAAKAAEKKRESPLEGLPPSLPALLTASKVISRMQRAGTPLDLTGTQAPEASVGDRLLALVAEAREQGLDPEQALRDAVRARL